MIGLESAVAERNFRLLYIVRSSLCWTIMFQLESVKWSFLVLLGISIFICSIIYLKARTSYAPTALSPLTCRPFLDNCQALPNTSSYTRWQRMECLDITYFDGPLICYRMQADLHFIMEPLSTEEANYPLAFIITIHKELEMFVRLLRAIYAPQNIYCIHVDVKAPEKFKTSVRRLADCFPNVFLASVGERVTYGGFSRLKADINCMEDLLKSPIKWKKVINLCGQDFPIKSNLELIRYMQEAEWRDINMTPGIKQPEYIQYRTQMQHIEVNGDYVASKGIRKDPPPHNLQIYFGTAYYSLTRAFVEYVLNSSMAQDLLEWSRDTYSPDEHYWVTLNHVKEAPGSNINGGWEGDIRAIKWKDQEGTVHHGCNGRYVRDICIYGTEDIPWIIEKNSMFANKFEITDSLEALDCLENWHRHKVLQQAVVPIQSSWHLAIEVNVSSAITMG
ncbi:putative beta-1,3-galactosyl-O-glycosyl-glycoprotein beta-1,6-N-acetylglucosaminyltransferase 7 [Brachyhypopomus gauderio]|uniref:putative beta-1,3-galactosyl-O-glycosyl-glycoprotein beta-1,6-N-acetylglucosaminyltransferase 7 n=1 Tax=Brachyhypopomus gauderio TaxID=698409 RepID=UPI0040419416